MKRGKKKKKKKPNNEPAILSFYIFVNFGEYTCDGDRMIEDPVRMESDGDMDTKIIENALVQVTGGGDDGELIEIPDGLKLVKHADVLDENIDPYIGMEFESEEAAMIYYDAYARRVGFIIRVGNCHRSGRDGSVISRRFLCNKEGFRVNNKKTKCIEVRKPRAITREGCKAMIMVRKEKSGKWVVTKLETEHSHPLGIPAGKGRQGTIQARPQDLSGTLNSQLSYGDPAGQNSLHQFGLFVGKVTSKPELTRCDYGVIVKCHHPVVQGDPPVHDTRQSQAPHNGRVPTEKQRTNWGTKAPPAGWQHIHRPAASTCVRMSAELCILPVCLLNFVGHS
ncbi:uncharacterized protein LOC122081899 isoform X2 [Macadamia integrifolia]|uniref:uncharacterized protein LOC122081899 isoform X2 n=1 Tax=Macadamia integrifolia TaxID=60698 RepID=UPI001C4F09EA|nr:uncharacterized protein LOC122081899 isoform X2 [Macadamia integrifolia]